MFGKNNTKPQDPADKQAELDAQKLKDDAELEAQIALEEKQAKEAKEKQDALDAQALLDKQAELDKKKTPEPKSKGEKPAGTPSFTPLDEKKQHKIVILKTASGLKKGKEHVVSGNVANILIKKGLAKAL